jgi:hypothetical protein
MVSEPVRPATWGSLRLSLIYMGFIYCIYTVAN